MSFTAPSSEARDNQNFLDPSTLAFRLHVVAARQSSSVGIPTPFHGCHLIAVPGVTSPGTTTTTTPHPNQKARHGLTKPDGGWELPDRAAAHEDDDHAGAGVTGWFQQRCALSGFVDHLSPSNPTRVIRDRQLPKEGNGTA